MANIVDEILAGVVASAEMLKLLQSGQAQIQEHLAAIEAELERLVVPEEPEPAPPPEPEPEPQPVPEPEPQPVPEPEPIPPSATRLILADFADEVVHDRAWAEAQPAGALTAVAPKGDSGGDEFSIVVGGGVGGSNALSVTAPDDARGLPGFWLLRYHSTGRGSLTRASGPGKLLTEGQTGFNRFGIRAKFPRGYRALRSAAQPPRYPNHQNMHIGTYHVAADRVGDTSVESHNMHLYYQMWLRHDLAQDGWIDIIVGEKPNHIRSVNQRLPNNMPALWGMDLWDSLTRFYFDGVPYNSDPEVPRPVTMLIDSIWLERVEPQHPIEFSYGWEVDPGQAVEVPLGGSLEVPFSFRNTGSVPIPGQIYVDGNWTHKPQLVGDARVEIPAGGEITGALSINPLASKPEIIGRTIYDGICFLPDDQLTGMEDETVSYPNHSDSRVEQRWNPTGSYDSHIYGHGLRVKAV